GVPVAFQLKTRLEGIFSDTPNASIEQTGESDPFRWTIKWFDENRQGQTATAEFYTADDNRLLCIVKRKVTIFNGPSVQPNVEEDIVYPSRAENLQPPSPSNPAGAHHVCLVDYPSADEIVRLKTSKYYDLLTDEQLQLITEMTSHHAGGIGSTGAGDPSEHKI